jgi:hypothetical protein
MGPMGPDGAQAEEAAWESFPDDLDQSPAFDPAEPEPIPDNNFGQSWGACPPSGPPAPPEVRPRTPNRLSPHGENRRTCRF